MSRNQEIKFVKYWEENVKEEYKNERHNFFTYDWWFEKLPKDLKEIILKIDNSSLEDDNYDSYLEELEMEIKDFIFEKNTEIMKMKKLNIYLNLWVFQK